jgi:mannose/fructose/N-acetylgalactosamine-specific phosphotransferase system component IID
MARVETVTRGPAGALALTLKSTLLPNLWNERTLQGPGFAWALGALEIPGGPRLVARHMAAFNTTPSMAPCVIGAVGRMESDGAPAEEIERVRDSGGASVAAIGDQLFSGSVRPGSALAGLIALPLGPMWAAVCLLLAQDLSQAAFRLLGAREGLRMGKAGIPRCVEWARRALRAWRLIGAVLVGVLFGAVVVGLARGQGAGGGLIALAAVPVMSWLIDSAGARPVWICLVLLASSGILSLVAAP